MKPLEIAFAPEAESGIQEKPTQDDFKRIKLHKWVAERMLGLGPTCRLDVEDAIKLTGRDAKSIRRARTSVAKRLGVELDFYDQQREVEHNGYRNPKFREDGGWETAFFALIIAADPKVELPVQKVLDIIANASRIPAHLSAERLRFRTRSAREQAQTVRSVQKRVGLWRKYYVGRRTEKMSCPFCAGISDRRPIPGVCPVCLEPGERELIERPEVLGSSGGTCADRGNW